MSAQAKKDLAEKGLIPSEPRTAIESSGRLANLKKGDIIKTVTNKELQALLGKGKYPCSLDFSATHFELESDQFLTACRDVVKDLCLSNNPLKAISSVDHLTKLKVLVANSCKLTSVSLNTLENLEFLSLCDNQLTSVPKLRNLQKLVNLDLSGNPIAVGFEELEALKSLQVLDLARIGLEGNIAQFYQFVVLPLKKIPKLTHLSFAENSVEVSIIKFRLFVLNELPKLKYVDWLTATKEERLECIKQERLWNDKTLAATPLKQIQLSATTESNKSVKIGGQRGGASSNSKLLAPEDQELIGLLLGDGKGSKSGNNNNNNNLDDTLDAFLKTVDAADDPFLGIQSLLDESNKGSNNNNNNNNNNNRSAITQSAGGDYEDELMRIIYGDEKVLQQKQTQQQQQQSQQQSQQSMVFVESAPAVTKQEGNKTNSVADTTLDDLLDSIIAVEQNKSGSVGGGGSRNALDQLLKTEEEARQKRLQEETSRIELEKARLERERLLLEEERKKELEREKLKLRAEMEAQKLRELDEERAKHKSGKDTRALEDEAFALLQMLEDDQRGVSRPAGSAAQDADALLASIDDLMNNKGQSGGSDSSANVTAPLQKAFGPRSSAVLKPSTTTTTTTTTASPAKVSVLSTGALPIARRKQGQDDEVDLLLESNSASTGSSSNKNTPGKGNFVCLWSQINCGDRLGVGTFGSVNLGWWKSSEVTVKKLKLQRFNDAYLEHFQEEVPKLVTLSHPNIIKFVGVCVDDTLCTLQGYVRGCALWGYLRQAGNLADLDFIARVSRGVVAGLAYLHSQKVIHRNLHSKNIILDGEMTPKLRDYGMLYVKNETYQLAMGSVAYEAPELLSRAAFTESVDAYSFGVVVWEMFCREDPYKGMNALAVKEQVIASELRPDVTPDIPLVFRKLMAACWNTEPARRPTMIVIGKILNKPTTELGSYGDTGAKPITSEPKLQGPALSRQLSQKQQQAPVDLVAQLHVPAGSENMSNLLVRIQSLLESNDKLTQQRGLRVVCNLCEKKEYADSLGELKPIVEPLIARGQVGNDKATRDLSLQALGKLCVVPDCSVEFLQCLGWPMLVSTLQSGDLPLELSASLLLVVLLKNPQNKDALVSVKGIPLLVDLLMHENDTVRTNAVWAASLALENEQTQRRFVENGGVGAILKLAQSSNPGVVLRVLISVGLLLTKPEVFQELKDSGVIQRFLRLLSSPSPLLLKHGIEAMVRFSEHSQLREAIFQHGGLQVLLELLAQSSDPKIKRLVVVVFGNFLDEDHHAMYVLDAQVMRSVIRLLVSSDFDLRMEVLKLISRCSSIPEFRPHLQSLGALAPLVQLLSTGERGARMAALYSICVLSEDESVAVALALADCASALLRLCESDMSDSDALELACESFGNLSRSSTGVSQLRDCSAFSFLVKIISSKNPVSGPALEGAATALVQSSTLPEGRLTIAALDGVAPLLRLCSSEDEVLRETVLWCCPNWCEGTTAEVVMEVALPALVLGLTDAKENVQSICVKSILLLAAIAEFRGRLVKARVKEGLDTLERTTANKTLKLAAAKAKSLLQ